MLRDGLRRPRLPVTVVAAALVSVLAGGTATAVHLSGAVPLPRSADVGTLSSAPGDAGLPRADRERTVTTEGATEPSPVATEPVGVAPLGALQVPDVVVRSSGPLAPERVAALRALPGVVAATLADSGRVSLGGGEADLLGVDPSEFRAFTPQETAASDPLWQTVARGDLAVSFALANQRSLPLGGDVVVADRPARLGAVAAFGLRGADVVLPRQRARELGAVPDAVLVLAAPGLKTAALRKAVESVAGRDLEVEVLRPADVAPSGVRGRPGSWRELYIDSARHCPGLRWQVLAAIGQVESGHGRNLGPSSAGALGPMQFLPSTWAAYGVDGDGDGTADIMSPFDAVPSAARYLCRNGAANGDEGLYNAIFAYNHADWYVRKVLAVAAQYQ